MQRKDEEETVVHFARFTVRFPMPSNRTNEPFISTTNTWTHYARTGLGQGRCALHDTHTAQSYYAHGKSHHAEIKK